MLSKFFINRPAFSAVISIILVIAGAICIRILPIEQYPQLVPTQVMVIAQYPGASAETISTSVASVIENSINGVEGMIYMQSSASSSGRLTTSVFFNNDVNPDMALVNVNNRVQSAISQLPSEVQRLGVTVRKRSTAVIGTYHLYSDNPNHNQLYIANYGLLNVLDELKRIPGVGDVAFWSSQDYAMRIWLNPQKLSSYNLSPLEVINIIQSQNAQFAPGSFGGQPTENTQFTYTITTNGLFSSVEEFENIIIRSNIDGSSLRLKDMARVELGAQEYLNEHYYNDIVSTPFQVFLQPGANMVEVADRVESTLAELSKSFPEGMQYSSPFRPTEFIHASINEVLKTFIEAIILVVLVIYVFLGNLRATIIPVIAIPVSIIGTFVGLYLFGFSINLLTLFGLILAIGIVVDDAIIVIENVERIMHTEHLSAKEATIKSMSEISGAIVAIVLVLSAVFIPVAFMGGFSGAIYRQFAITLVISVVISGAVALTLTPALCAIFLKKKESKPFYLIAKFNSFFDWLTARFSAGVAKVLRRGILFVILFIGLVGISYDLFQRLPTSLVPAEDMGFIQLHTILPEGASIERTDKVQRDVIKILLEEEPLVSEMTTAVGFSGLQGSFKSSAGVGFHRLIDWSERKGEGEGIDEIIERLRNRLSDYPEARFIINQTPTIIGMDSSGANVWLQNRIGASMEELQRLANLIVEEAGKSPAISQVFTNIAVNTPQYKANLNREAASALGVNISDVFSTMQVTFGSYYVNNFELYNKIYQVVAQADWRYRQSPSDLSDVFVKSNNGNLIPLSSLVSVERVVGAEVVNRFNVFPAAQIMAFPSMGFSSGDVLGAIEEAANKVLPEGFSLAYAGSSYQERANANTAPIAFAFGLIFVFLILVAQYERWLMPLAVLTAVPFGIFGAVLATFIRGLENDIYLQVGLLILIALSAKNAILIVEFATHLREQEKQSIIQSAINAAKLRFRPIVMTSLAFSMGVLPLAISSGAGSLSRHAIGTGVIGGMLSATFMAIFFVPLFYVYLAKLSEWIKSKRDKIEK
ncbi:multidrug efflux RND transporter permease subunit [Helicobacter sp. 16-1353]|uniref:efflux RND transporter permease subunit n=1 Tax=Helicobacter sp. 16-1353 TaxID=2004996 RepID=UPI000DCE5948|nr:multidrug efflux RND transporter permease subunit [Helicobacter sp. 16-1353]RAX54647.1 multidrug efflux RND transporter permease subunit [Helicobacter sp. 16-1353]